MSIHHVCGASSRILTKKLNLLAFCLNFDVYWQALLMELFKGLP
jgi:hypothetical protein